MTKDKRFTLENIESQPNPLLKSIKESAGIRVAILFGAFFVMLIIASIVNSIITKLPGSERSHLLIASVIQDVIVFCLPAIFMARYTSQNWKNSLYLTNAPKLKSLLGVVAIYLISMPAMEWIVDLNTNIRLPESMKSIEDLFRGWEDAAASSTDILLESSGWFSTLVGVLVIGVLTGFSEELFFRAGFQGTLLKGSAGKNMAVWTAAIIFSAMHFQFYGFLPRLIMGLFFGYLLVWTRSLWVPIFAHALNNSVVVIASALTEGESTSIFTSGEAAGYIGNPYAIFGSIVFTALFLIIFRNDIFKTEKSDPDKWQRSQFPPVSER